MGSRLDGSADAGGDADGASWMVGAASSSSSSSSSKQPPDGAAGP